MRRQRKHRFLQPLRVLGLAIISCMLAACSEDEPYPSIVTNFVDAMTDANGMVTSIRTDNGTVYTADSQIRTNTADSVLRCICMYETRQQEKATNSAGQHFQTTAHIRSLQHVFSDEPLPRSAFSALPQDPVKVTSVWKGGRYINMHLGILTTDEGKHAFAFCEDSLTTSLTGHTSVYLSLLHQRPEHDPESYTRKAYLSMPIHHYSDIDTIIVRINSYEGMKEFTYYD